jgi:hypothetical protein
MHVYHTSMNTSERLIQLNLKIYEVPILSALQNFASKPRLQVSFKVGPALIYYSPHCAPAATLEGAQEPGLQ